MDTTDIEQSQQVGHSSPTPKEPLNLWYHLSRTTQRRPQSSIKKFYKYFAIPGIGQLAGGLPAPAYFPFDNLEASVALPDRWRPTPNDPVEPPSDAVQPVKSSKSKLPSSRLHVPKASGIPEKDHKIDLETALQYGQAQGYPPLYSFLLEFTRKNLHPNIPYAGGPDITLTVGNTDGFSKCIQAFNNEWSEGDPIGDKEGLLVEEYAYMNAIQTSEPRGMNTVPVAIDDQGMLAEGKGGLRDVLENWDFHRGRMPHLMYTVTMGQNPTSGVLSVERRQEIYLLCQKYDILIIEDDPYWYLQYPSATNQSALTKGYTLPASHPFSHKPKSSGYEFLDSLQPSYLSLDVDGRVLRLDTFSKTIAPGCRLGWITAQPMFVERILRIAETSTQQPSGFVQSMVAELLMGPQSKSDPGRGGGKNGTGWDTSGWVRWLEGLRGNYERRMQLMSRIMNEGREMVLHEEHDLQTGDADAWTQVSKRKIFDFPRPMGGMFLWLTVYFHLHPLAQKITHSRLSDALWIYWTTEPYRVLASPGTIFGSTPEIKENDGWKHFRLCFAACPDEEVEPITKRLVKGLHDFWEIKDTNVIDKLLEDEGESLERMVEGIANLGGPC